MEKTILVIGGTGMLGKPVAHHLNAAGYKVRVFSRSAQKARTHFGSEYEIAQGDVENPHSLAAALQGCYGVHVNLQDGFDPDLERRGANAAAQAARTAGVQRITFISGASVCEQNCWYAGTQAKFAGEQAIQASGVPYTVFRCHYFMEVLRNFVRGKLALLIGKHPHPYYWVAAQDYARMVAKAYATPASENKILYVCGPAALSMRQALQTFTQIAHPETRLTYIPIWLTRIIAHLGNRKELQAALPFLEYCQKTKIILSGSPEEANSLLGAPTTTVAAWSRAQTSSPPAR